MKNDARKSCKTPFIIIKVVNTLYSARKKSIIGLVLTEWKIPSIGFWQIEQKLDDASAMGQGGA